ncbi:MAG: hypothetical protein ABEH90_00900 [Halolamina sp.]
MLVDDEEFAGEALLVEYENHREEIRLIEELQDRLFVRGIAVLGALVGYAFYRPENKPLLAFLPFVFGLFFVRYISLARGMSLLASHIHEIERRIDVERFDWESRFGMTSESAAVYERVPLVAVYTLVALLYVFSIGVGITVTPDGTVPFLGRSIDSNDIGWLYGFFSLFLLLVAGSSIRTVLARRRRFLDSDAARVIDRLRGKAAGYAPSFLRRGSDADE